MEQEEERDRLGLTERITQNGGAVLPEDVLRDLSKSLTKFVPKIESSIDALERWIRQLLTTASSTSIPVPHGTASLNTLCGFLDLCSASSKDEVRGIAFDPQTWTKAFRILLESSANKKAKPTRRLLTTLTGLLSRQPLDRVKKMLTESAVSSSVSALFGSGDTISIKMAVQVLEHLLVKNVIAASLIIDLASGELEQNSTGDRDACASISRAKAQNFISQILEWLEYPDCVSAISRFLPVFVTALERKSFSERNVSRDGEIKSALPIWIDPVKLYHKKYPLNLESLEKHVLPCLLSLSERDSKAFLDTLPLENIRQGSFGSCSEADLQLCLLTARVRTSLRLGKSKSSTTLLDDQLRYSLDPEVLGCSLLDHANPSVRTSAFSMLTIQSVVSKPLPNNTLARLKVCIPYFHQETSARVRNEFIAAMKKLCRRVEGVAISVPRSELSGSFWGESSGTEHENVQQHSIFMHWYGDFLVKELRPSASYQSHITALSLLDFLLEANFRCFETRTRIKSRQSEAKKGQHLCTLLPRTLLGLLFDPFDDVRQVSAAIIEILLHREFNSRKGFAKTTKMLSGEDSAEAYHGVIIPIIESVEPAQALFRQTGRADHADGLGRLLDLSYSARRFSAAPYNQHWMFKLLVSDLEQDIHAANKDLDQAVNYTPVHGNLIALRYIINRPSAHNSPNSIDILSSAVLIQKLIDLCRKIWDFVRPILCADAPEGQDSKIDSMGISASDGKERLSFCWRALKESSLLIHAVNSRLAMSLTSWDKAPYMDIHRQLGRLCFQQLAELRHRGAFSTVSQTFASWCVSCTRSEDLDIAALPKTYYQDTLDSFQQNASALTRRSAGLPAMITGILSAYSVGDFFNDVILDLQAIAHGPISHAAENDGMELPQVHALNCLKDIFTDSRFGPSSETHIANTLDLAAACLDCPVWAIRNCGLMLMKALLKRINGGTDTSSTKAPSSHRRLSKLAFHKFPILADLTLRLLCSHLVGETTSDAPGGVLHAQKVFPALEIVERFDLPSRHRDAIKRAILDHLEGPVWALRDKAAKVLSLIVDEKDLMDELHRLLSDDWRSHNALHGRLLQSRWLIRRFGMRIYTDIKDVATALLNSLDNTFETLVLVNSCPFTTAAYLDVVADVIDCACQADSNVPAIFIRRHRVHLASLQVNFNARAGQPSLSLCEIAMRRCQTQFDAYLANRNNASEVCSPLPESLWPSKTLQQHDELFQMRGGVIHAGFVQASGLDTSIPDLTAWSRSLVLAGAESSDVSTRLAAVFSIGGYIEKLKAPIYPKSGKAEMLYVYLALYDSLLDDDEEVREEGARIASSLLSKLQSEHTSQSHTRMFALSPPAAKAELMRCLVQAYGRQPEFWTLSIFRLTGLTQQLEISARIPGLDTIISESPISWHRNKVLEENSVPALYEISARQNQAVFAEEKQNLYIDTIRETEAWADVLRQLEVVVPVQDDFMTRWCEWTATGFELFCRKLDYPDDGKTQLTGGSLGTSSMPDVFALIYRVMVATKIYIHYLDRGYFGESSQKSIIMTELGRLLANCKKVRVHDLLLDQMAEMLRG